MRAVVAAVLGLVLAGAPSPARAAPAGDYFVRCLGAGGLSSAALRINERGEILGRSSLGEAGNPYGWIWRNDAVERSDAVAIDSSGGAVLSRDGRLYLAQDGEVLAEIGPAGENMVSAMNDHGQLVGQRGLGTGRATLWRWDGADLSVVDLGTLGGPFSTARAINEVGDIVGQFGVDDRTVHAFFWRDGIMTDLETLAGGSGSDAYAVNAAGQVAGISYTSDRLPRAVLWTDDTIIDLGTLTGGERSYSYAYGINDDGVVVGGTHDVFMHQAFVWSNGSMTGLGDQTYEARSINSEGWIAGTSLCGAFVATLR
jgi:probable HAF family extracellular repeat protein